MIIRYLSNFPIRYCHIIFCKGVNRVSHVQLTHDSRLKLRYMSSDSCSLGPNTRHRNKRRRIEEEEHSMSRRTVAQMVAQKTVLSEQDVPLTEVEAKLKRFLLDVCKFIDSKDQRNSNALELRFTGGWVRDKLLGHDSHDIDIGINSMTGYAFGSQMLKFLEIPQNAENYQLDQSSAKRAGGGLHKIEANPEKSKHLETVTTRLFGLDLDFVNLRKETYTEDSRNPQMEFGTPEEDALRRDATINALFYNLQTSQVEDFTKRGFDDMKAKLIRTPLEPHQTFKDDPLRILRLIRFASRLKYTIDKASEEAMANLEVKQALRLKISRERIGVEIEKMLKGPDPAMALSLIERLGLYEDVFTNPTTETSLIPELNRLEPSYTTTARILDASTLINAGISTDPFSENYGILRDILVTDSNDTYLAWILASSIPWAGLPDPEPHKKGGKVLPIITNIFREGIKANNKICDVLTASKNNLEDIRQLQERLNKRKRYPHKSIEGDDAAARDVLGMAIRRWGKSWRSQVIFAILYDVSDNPEQEKETIKNYTAFVLQIKNQSLTDAYSLKPLIDGKALSKALCVKPGPWMQEALDVVMAWQLIHPDVTNPTQAIEAVREKQSELSARLAHHVLALTIRPLFEQRTSKTFGVTASGRKDTRNVPVRRHEHLDAGQAPWKTNDYALDLLKWVLRSLDEKGVDREWPLLIPPILTVMDDPASSWQTEGCVLARLLLEATPPPLLKKTGLAGVLEQALKPCLLSLPTLTPEAESARLLGEVYPALILLANKAHAAQQQRAPPGGTTSLKAQSREKALDDLVRNGILAGFLYAGEHVKIAKVLLEQLRLIVEQLGVPFVKHLKQTLPMLSRILSEPLGSAYPPLLLAAAKTLQTVILNSWPRMTFHRNEVLRGTTVCWLRLQEEGKGKYTELEGELKTVIEMLAATIEGEVEWRAEFQRLEDADERLKDLLDAGRDIVDLTSQGEVKVSASAT